MEHEGLTPRDLRFVDRRLWLLAVVFKKSGKEVSDSVESRSANRAGKIYDGCLPPRNFERTNRKESQINRNWPLAFCLEAVLLAGCRLRKLSRSFSWPSHR